MEKEKTITDLRNKINELAQRLAEARHERERLNDKAIQWATKRDRLHEEIKKLRSEARGLKEKRDTLNNDVQSLKTLREDARKAYREKLEQLQGLRQKAQVVMAKKPPRSAAGLESEIAAIDWKIQTNPLPLDEEKRLVEQVKTLECQLAAYRSIEGLRINIAKLRDEAKALRDENKSHGERISETAEQSQKFHQQMTEELEKSWKLKAEADEMHEEYVKNKEQAHAAHLKYLEILSQIEPLEKASREREEKEKSEIQESLRNKLEKEALEKLRSGKKMSFEEFKVLAERDKI